jgi:NAD(P)-dependent dehydrogenase (short-subunit alcohol dehydrogenase family)
MMDQVSGRVAFVTGAASGIGLGMVRAFLGAGMRVMLADVEAPALARAIDTLREELPAHRKADIASVQADVADRASVDRAAQATLDTFGKVHIVCNNAGVISGGLIDETRDGDWQWVMGVNVMGVVHGCQAFVPHLKRQGEGGHIVNTASMAGVLGAMAGWSPYNTSKFAVVGLTEVIRQEGKTAGYSASVLCPGGVATNIFHAPRNRGSHYGPQQSAVAEDLTHEDVQRGLDPDIVGRLVLEAIQANRLFIFTDPRLAGRVERRHQKLMADFEWASRSRSLVDAKAPGSQAPARKDD